MAFVARALTSALNYYKDINPSTLTGAIDVIVVQRPNSDEPDGIELACTPFHVRFGKLSVLRAAEKKVTLHLNDSETPLEYSMKVGDAGEAFFVFETDIDVPEDLQTSPIISPIDNANNNNSVPVSPLPQAVDAKPGVGLNLDLPQQNQEPEPLSLNPNDSDNSENAQQTQSSTGKIVDAASAVSKVGTAIVGGAAQAGNLRVDKLKRSRPSKLDVNTFERDEEPSDKYLPKYEAKGPSVVYADDVVLDLEGYKQSKDDSYDQVENRRSDLESESIAVRDALHDVDQDKSGSHTPEDLALATFGYDLLTSAHGKNFSLAPNKLKRKDDKEHTEVDDIDGVDEQDLLMSKSNSNNNLTKDSFDVEELKSSLEGLSLSNPTNNQPPQDEYTWEWGGFPTRSTQATPIIEKPSLGFNHMPTASQDSTPQPRPTLKCGDNEYQFVLEMENVKHVFELAVFNHSQNEIDGVEFEKNKISYQRFIDDVNLVDSKGLVCRYKDSYLDWFSSAPVIASLAIYRRSLTEFINPATASHKDDHDVDVTKKAATKPQTSDSGWSRWWSKSKSDPDLAATAATHAKNEPQQQQQQQQQQIPNSSQTPPTTPPKQDRKHYAKTLRLTSDQLKSLNLKKGVNNITFSVNSSYSGVAMATARIFYWNSTDQVVISDIDGTITKSDALGHVFTMIGRDWTHIGVAKLYTDIAQNGYQILYLTSRAIGQADTTRDYLKGIRQKDYQLPDGPVIMSPDRLMASLHREVIMRKPEVFKMAALRDIQRVFDKKNPFYAGFGNRITDAMSYRSVNVPSSRIFTIDSIGEVKMELLELAGYKSSYIHMTDLVDQMFPSINNAFEPAFTDFNYWKPSIPDVELPDLSPPSPALSARSDQSTTSKLGMFWPSSIASSLSRRGSTATSPVSTALDDEKKSRRSRASSPDSRFSRATSPVSDFVLSEEEEEESESGEDDDEDEDDDGDSDSDHSHDCDINDVDDLTFDTSDIANKSSSTGERSTMTIGDDMEDDFDEDILATREMNKVPFL
ncbi:hypothetical protein E3P99_00680 [Wallemia hederae]|uniref:phosphatidate phosphatase n=1 Tax=Wallemia hederae TaxID=1540922 RepID=A0A4T0FVJ8_9BASI|nr:hypothetical protein E3P99_00680 [Wallemia hederae]